MPECVIGKLSAKLAAALPSNVARITSTPQERVAEAALCRALTQSRKARCDGCLKADICDWKPPE